MCWILFPCVKPLMYTVEYLNLYLSHFLVLEPIDESPYNQSEYVCVFGIWFFVFYTYSRAIIYSLVFEFISESLCMRFDSLCNVSQIHTFCLRFIPFYSQYLPSLSSVHLKRNVIDEDFNNWLHPISEGLATLQFRHRFSPFHAQKLPILLSTHTGKNLTGAGFNRRLDSV